MTSWLIDTALFKSLAPSGPGGSALRSWIEAHEEPIFLSAASIVELQAAIDKAPQLRRGALQMWLDGIVANFGDRIHPVDGAVALRAGALLRLCTMGHPRHRFHDAALVATAQIFGYGLLSTREGVFGAWTQIAVRPP